MYKLFLTLFLINSVFGYNDKCEADTQNDDISVLFNVYSRDIRVGVLNKATLSLNNSDTTSLYAIPHSLYGLDFNLKGNYFIRSDERKIYLSPYHDNWRKSQETVLYNFEDCEPGANCDHHQIAIDWIHNLLYFSNNSAIYVAFIDKCNIKVAHRIISQTSDHIKGIVVNPFDYFIAWIAWIGEETKIIKSSQDGSEQRVLVERNIKKSFALSLDFEDERIYWIDNELFTLSSIDYYGNNRRTIVESEELFKSCFKMDIMDDYVFWTDENRKVILKSNKNEVDVNEKPVAVVSADNAIEAFKIIKSSRQRFKANVCEFANCFYMCLPINATTYRCVCPEFKFENGKQCTHYSQTIKLIDETTTTTITTESTTHKELNTNSDQFSLDQQKSSSFNAKSDQINDNLNKEDYILITLMISSLCLFVSIIQFICLMCFYSKVKSNGNTYDDTFIQYNNRDICERIERANGYKRQSQPIKMNTLEQKNIYESLN